MLLLIFSLLNRARGSRLFGFTDSTTVGRLISSFFMAFAMMLYDVKDAVLLLPVVWGSLLVWMIPAWDSYWSAEIGHDSNHSKLWGLGHMAARMSLAAVPIMAVAFITGGSYWWAFAAPILALPYYFLGFWLTDPIPASEYVVGAMLGFLMWGACGL